MPKKKREDSEISFPEDTLKMAQEFKRKRLEKEVRKDKRKYPAQSGVFFVSALLL